MGTQTNALWAVHDGGKSLEKNVSALSRPARDAGFLRRLPVPEPLSPLGPKKPA